MKFRIIETLKNLFESRLTDVQIKFPGLKKSVIEQLANVDPSKNNKYLNWMAKQLDRGYNFSDIEEYIKYFHKHLNAFKDKNIWNFNTLQELIEDVENMKERQEIKKLNISKSKERDVILNDEKYLIVSPKTHEASMKYGKGTKWCTTQKDSNYWDQYSSHGVFYYILNKKIEDKSNYKIAIFFDVARKNSMQSFDATDKMVVSGDLVDGEIYGAPLFAKEGMHLKRTTIESFKDLGIDKYALKLILKDFKNSIYDVYESFQNSLHVRVVKHFLDIPEEDKSHKIEFSEDFIDPPGIKVDDKNYVVLSSEDIQQKEQDMYDQEVEMVNDDIYSFITFENVDDWLNDREFENGVEEYFYDFHHTDENIETLRDELTDDFLSKYEGKIGEESEEAFNIYVDETIESRYKSDVEKAIDSPKNFLESYYDEVATIPEDWIDFEGYVEYYMQNYDAYIQDHLEVPSNQDEIKYEDEYYTIFYD